jgi:NAD(P)-dependent dehydrogenase (short-subunit alcohol dehydrogenase family)
MSQVLKGKVALVAGATRGAGRGIAVELGPAGATVYLTGRTTRMQRSEYNRPETIEETAELVERAGGQGISVRVDHLDPVQVQALVARIDSEQSHLDVLVNYVWGADFLAEWNVPVWEHSLVGGTALAAARNRHAYHHQPLRTTNLDQESGRSGCRDDGRHCRIQQCKLPVVAVL